jgi:hypothetical protein
VRIQFSSSRRGIMRRRHAGHDAVGWYSGQGWLIFGLPASEVSVYPSDANDRNEPYLMCDDVEAVAHSLRDHGMACTPLQEEHWGILMSVTLPGGGEAWNLSVEASTARRS